MTVDDLVRRYLAAFGPASVGDVQKWCGLTRLREVVDRQTDLLRLRGPEGVELIDVPDASWTAADAPAPVRFLPEFDNVLLSYVDGSRVLAPRLRPAVFSANGIIRSTVLVDGFVRALWKIAKTRTRAVLEVSPLATLTAVQRREIEREGAALLAFDSPRRTHDIRIG